MTSLRVANNCTAGKRVRTSCVKSVNAATSEHHDRVKEIFDGNYSILPQICL